MNMVDSNMLEVDDMDTLEEHFHLMNHRPEMKGMDTVEDHFHPMNHRSNVEGMDTMDTDMREDRGAELDVIEREPDDVVLTMHLIDDGATRHRRTRREWEELMKPELKLCRGMDTMDTDMREDRAAELNVIETELKDVVLTRH
jgi:hypothetical protein